MVVNHHSPTLCNIVHRYVVAFDSAKLTKELAECAALPKDVRLRDDAACKISLPYRPHSLCYIASLTASGLYYIAEFVEEYPKPTKQFITYAIWVWQDGHPRAIGIR
jgi:hypothetical protein